MRDEMHERLRTIVTCNNKQKKKRIKFFHLIRIKSDLKIFQMKFPIGYEWITAGYSTCENNKKKKKKKVE